MLGAVPVGHGNAVGQAMFERRRPQASVGASVADCGVPASDAGASAMAALMLVSATVGITKALRDKEESDGLHNKLEEARTERLLAEVSQTR